ncbi:MAG: glycine--tRNA ligase subunit beta [Desulfarculus sp.]|nr:glycine--tRNA ligase subunit beta [Desulfarculus sp.]
MAELPFEIGSEEMPARFVAPAMAALSEIAGQELTRQGLAFEGLETFGTPRRLALVVRGLAPRQADRQEVALGPPVKAAYDASGQASKAALGFAKGQGIEVGQLEHIETDKGPRLGFTRHIPGRAAGEVLGELLPRLVTAIPFPKTMRWGGYKLRYARPIHWMLALLDGAVIPFELTDIQSGNLTYGHRFHAPGAVVVKDAADYLQKLAAGQVMAQREQRKLQVIQEVQAAAGQAGGRLLPDPGLIEEVTDLVELPVACCGTFDREFLEVPRAVIINAMRSHQRYFALEDAAGELLPAFVAVNNTKAVDPAVVTQGHQRVLRARLSDARFFLHEDMKRPLISRLEDLKQVTYHAKLGTSLDKVERCANLAVWLAGKLLPAEVDKVRRAAQLAKCDLVTQMVGEFPDLQGQVGRDYAQRNGEDDGVALAILEHYLPTGAGGDLPTGMIGTIVGIADRLDTICGLFGVGQTPTGAADPYALRRAAIAIIRLVMEKGLKLSLGRCLDQALAGLGSWLARPAAEVKSEVTEFFATRLAGMLAEQGVPTDVAEAVLAAGLDDLGATQARALALAEMKKSQDFAALAAGLKRVMNILRKEAAQVPATPPDPARFAEDAERQLFEAFTALRAEAQARFAAGEYLAFLQGLSALKGPIDKFFDDVMVMVEDQAVRHNRLALLNQIASEFGKLAMFTHLQLA